MATAPNANRTNRTRARRRRRVPLTANPTTGGYPYRIGPWALETNIRTPARAGMCEGCHVAGFSSTTPGLPYVPPDSNHEQWESYIKWLCADCLACSAISDGVVQDFRRWPPVLVIREPNGTYTTSKREIRVKRERNEVALLATTSTGDKLPPVMLPSDVQEWRVREQYAQLVRALDAADPVPPFVPPVPREERLALGR